MTSFRQLKGKSNKQPVKVAKTDAPYPSIITQVNQADEKKAQSFDIMNMFKCCSMLWRCLAPKKDNFDSITEVSTPGLLERQLPQFHGKKTLVLDLDETLVHSTFEPIENPDLVLPVVIKEVTYRINVMIRPGTQEFLARMGELFEVVVFTASLAEYAEPLVKVLDTTNVVSYLLFRQHCTPLNGIYVKDLSLLGRDMRNIILIDNSPNSFLFQPQNAYHISNFFDDKTDRDLYKLAYFLENIVHLHDVRPIEDHRKKYEQPYAHGHSSGHMKFIMVKNNSVANQEQDPDAEYQSQEDDDQGQNSSVDLEEICVAKADYPSKGSMKKKEDKDKVYNVETEPDLGREGRDEEFPKTIISERNKDKAGLYSNYYSKAGPLTERVVVNDRLIPQALESSVDLELPSPKESDALINHREADAFFENNTNSSDSSKKSKPIIPPFPRSGANVFASGNLVAVNDPTLEGHKVEDVRFLTGLENLNSPLGRHVKIDLTNKMEAGC